MSLSAKVPWKSCLRHISVNAGLKMYLCLSKATPLSLTLAYRGVSLPVIPLLLATAHLCQPNLGR